MADVYFTSTNGTPTAPLSAKVPVTTATVGGNTTIKYYLPATFTLATNTDYYTYLVTRDQAATADTISTAGSILHIDPLSSIALDSSWNFKETTAPATILSSVETRDLGTATGVTPTFTWTAVKQNLAAAGETMYTLRISTAATMANPILTSPASTTASYIVTAANQLKPATTYYAQVTAVMSNAAVANVPLANRTRTSPIFSFNTLSTPDTLASGKVYTFDTGATLPDPLILTATVSSISFAGGAAVQTTGGNGGGAVLQMPAASTLNSTQISGPNKNSSGTFKFDVSVNGYNPGGNARIWNLAFDSNTSFNPTTWDPATTYVANPGISGPLVAAVYYTDDPATPTGAVDPVYAIYAFALARNVADTLYTVTRTKIADIATINATTGKVTFGAPYITVTLAATQTGTTYTVNGTSVDLSVVQARVNDGITANGIRALFTSNYSNIYLDNVSFAGATGFVANKR